MNPQKAQPRAVTSFNKSLLIWRLWAVLLLPMFATEAPVKIATRDQGLSPEISGDSPRELLTNPDPFPRRHIGPNAQQTKEMLELLGYPSLEALIDEAIPAAIRLNRPLQLPAGRSEHEVLASLRAIASQNQVFRSYWDGLLRLFHPSSHPAEHLEIPGGTLNTHHTRPRSPKVDWKRS